MSEAYPKLPLWRRWQFHLALVLLVVLVVYAASFDLKLYADDYIAWSKVLNTIDQPWHQLFGANYNPEFYRPFEHLLIRLNVHLSGTNPVPYRVATVLGHLLMVIGVFWLARRFRFGYTVAVSAALIFGLSHANAMAALSNDAACQIYNTLFGTIALGLMLRDRGDEPVPLRRVGLSAIWFLGALFWKDAGISYAPALAYLLLREVLAEPPGRRGRRLFALAWPFALVLAVYFAMRFNAGVSGPGFGNASRYNLWFGLNVPINIFLFLLGMFTPLGSSIVVLRMHDPFFDLVWCGAILVTVGIFALGYRQRWRQNSTQPQRLLSLTFLMFIVMLPDVLMVKVSELYVYQPNIFFAILFAAGLLSLYRLSLRPHRLLALAALNIFVMVLVVSHSFSILHKMHRMRDNGLLTAQLTQEIKEQMPTLTSRKVLAVNRYPGPAPLYSIYYMEGVYVLGGGKVFEYLYGEKLEEFRYYPYEQLDAGLTEIPGKKVILLYRKGHVKVVEVEGAANPF